MEETPGFYMQCPKCSGKFPPTETYCEKCSALLEPVEVEEKKSVAPQPLPQKAAKPLSVPPSPQPVQGEPEDLLIETLKAEIEDKFVCALLLEKEQLERRLKEKEREAQEMQKGMGDKLEVAKFAALQKKEKEIEELISKSAHTEHSLDELKKTITAEIAQLESRAKQAGAKLSPGKGGQSARMISAELKTKREILEMMDGKRPVGVVRSGGRSKMPLIAGVAVLAVLVLAWLGFSSWTKGRGGAEQPAVAAKELKAESPSREAVAALLDDIKKANLEKDLGLWESRYSRQYLQTPGKREGVAEQWKEYDYRSLEYSIEDLQISPQNASAVITWDMSLLSKKGDVAKAFKQRLLAEFTVEEGRLKISSVAKQ